MRDFPKYIMRVLMKLATEAHFEQTWFPRFFAVPLLLLVIWSLKRMKIKGEKVELPEVVSSCGSDCLEIGGSSS